MTSTNQDMFRSSFETMYSSGSKSKKQMFENYQVKSAMDSAIQRSEYAGTLSLEHDSFDLISGDADEYAIQRPIREWFGKRGINRGRIGAHPDFIHLVGTDETIHHHITTVFIDIKNSTRLSLRYDLGTVQKIKNTILRAASETVRALDGHVHRFMGDALMAYFGGLEHDRESSSMAAINCAAMLRLLMDESIGPGLLKQGIEANDIGFRVGIDYGNDNDVLWSSYGYTDVSEVTATSFYVDAAAKLQSMASKDCAMLGNNLISHLDFPDNFVGPKTEMKEGKPELVPFLRPNYSLLSGGSHNYRIHELKFEEFSSLLPIPLEMRQELNTGAQAFPGISFKAFVHEGETLVEYKSLSRCVSKGTDITFQIFIEPHVLDGKRLPLAGKWKRINHGQEAFDAKMSGDEVGRFDVRPNPSNKGRNPQKYSWGRTAQYRGIHTMEVKIFDTNSVLIFSDIIGVHIR